MQLTEDIGIWLQERTIFSSLPSEVIDAIASGVEFQTVPQNTRILVENTPPTGLYILKSGQLEGDRNTQMGSIWSISFLPGAAIPLQEILFEQPLQRTIVTLSPCEFYWIRADKFRQIATQYPIISQTLSQQLVQELAQLSSQLSYEQERQTVLRPYLVTKAKRGIVGKSRYATRLRQDIKKASIDRKPALIFGEPGLEKDNIAALIHYGSSDRRQPIIKVDCGRLQATGVELFGRSNGQNHYKPGLLHWLGNGTLLLNNIQELPSELLPKIAHLIQTNTYSPIPRSSEESTTVQSSSARIIMVGEKHQPKLEKWVKHSIKVPPLRVRKADISAQIDYYISLFCRAKGLEKPHVTPEALRRLQAYDFPANLKELQGLVERAIVQSMGAKELTEEVFWSVATKKKQFRVNLLNSYLGLRKFLRSPWWPDRINYGFTAGFFAIIVALLFFGPQSRAENVALNLFWAWWWPLILIAFPFVGRLWCAVCPFMIYGEITQKIKTKFFPNSLKKWPRQSAEQWGGWFLFGLFTLIFLWEELWNLENTAYLSACLLLLITAGAMIFSAIFERRFWCRYLCPIGGMNGLFAKLSMIELRAQQGTCSAECTTYQCYKGGPQKGEGLETLGCPIYSHPAQLEDNKDCVLCMTCLKACPHRSVELNLRPPGIELWTSHTPHAYEVALLLLLLGGVYLHRLPEINNLLNLNLNLNLFFPHAILSILALIIPCLIPILGYKLLEVFQFKARSFVELAYGYLPLVLAANLAHYLTLGLGEAGRILPVTFATFGLSGEGLPVFIAHPAVIEFLQGTTLIFGLLLTVILTQKIARQSLGRMFPQHLSAIALFASLWFLIVR